MRRTLHLLLALLLLPAFAFAQKDAEKSSAPAKKAETYKKYLDRSSSSDVTSLLNEANSLKETNPAVALDRVQEALGLSIAQGNVFNEGKCYLLLAQINEGIQEWKLALDNYNSAYEKLRPDYPRSIESITALLGLAASYVRINELDRALELYNRGLNMRIGYDQKNKFRIGISEVYYQKGDYNEALSWIDQAEEGKQKGGNDDVDVTVQNQKAKIYARLNDFDRAKNAIQSSSNTLRGSPSTVPQAQEQGLKDAKEELAGVLHEQKRYDEEIDLRNQSIEYNLETNNLPEVTEDKVGISKALAAKGETSEAIRELEEAALMADTINNPEEQANAFLALADLFEKNNRNSEALRTYKRYSQAVKRAELQQQSRLVEKSELIDKQKEISSLGEDVRLGQAEYAVEKATVTRQRLVIYGLLLIIIIIAVTSYFIYRNAQASKVANQMLALKSLRSQMNPHFIFNALNSVNHFVAQNDERTVNKFLSEFSRLMRLVMENSQEDFIPLYKEQEIIALYLKLEHYRFRDKFDYELVIDESINLESVQVPPMLIQPYIENAVWHGLRYKDTKGFLSLKMKKNSDGLEVEITDNGIGRKKSAELKTENQRKQQSTGIKNIEQRLRIINKVYKSRYRVQIQDLTGETGTRVLVTIPTHNTGNGTEI